MKEESSPYLNIRILYKVKSLIYRLVVIALVGEIRCAIGARMGINKVQVKTQTRQKEHMVAGLEGDKR